jgi:hypothetical protein
VRRVFQWLVVAILLGSSSAGAQEWARKIFNKTSHDFGTVAKGSKQEYAFEFTNIYKEELHVASVRSSCGCTTPRVTNYTLKTFEKSQVIAVYNTGSFDGAKNATVTVVFDRPYPAEVQLYVSGYIRRDVVFHPGVVDFGSVPLGAGKQTTIQVNYAGRGDWEIVDVRSANQHLEVELQPTERAFGRVGYKMTVYLKTDAPAGFIQDQLTLVTNDEGAKHVSLPVEGQVVSPLSVRPASLFLGNLAPGETVKKRLVVKGHKPFRIVEVKSDGEGFQFDKPSEERKELHFVTFEFKAGSTPADIAHKIQIVTDMGDGLTVECQATATVK